MKKYLEPIVEILNWKEEDIVRTSPGNADFDDPFIDDYE